MWIFDKYLINQEDDPRDIIIWFIFPWKVAYISWPWQTPLPCHPPSSIQGTSLPHCLLLHIFQNLPWILASRDPDHLRSSGQLSGWTWSSTRWLVRFAVSALFWRVGIKNFSEDLRSGRTCALNLDQPPVTWLGVREDLCSKPDQPPVTWVGVREDLCSKPRPTSSDLTWGQGGPVL